MRTVLAITVIVLSMALLGWLNFSSDSSGATVRFNGDEASRDIDHAAKSTKTAIDKTLGEGATPE